MNGPEHYRRAESLLEQLRKAHASMTTTVNPERAAAALAEAQVHATLALAAATAMHATADGTELGVSEAEFQAWYDAAGVKEREATR